MSPRTNATVDSVRLALHKVVSGPLSEDILSVAHTVALNKRARQQQCCYLFHASLSSVCLVWLYDQWVGSGV